MEQSTSSRSKTESYFETLLDPDEIEVADILLDLPNLIQREFPSQFHVIWGGRRKRSAIDSNPSQEEEEEKTEKEKRLKVKVKASSPTTPFSFSPSESDEKSQLSLKKSSTKTTREERMEIIDELTQRGELLKGEIEAVKSYYNKLKAINMDLKAKKRELEMCKKFNKAENHQDYYYSMAHQQPPNVDNQTAYIGSQTTEKFPQHPHDKIPQFFSSGFGSGEVKQMGPLCIPELNVSLVGTFVVDPFSSSQPLDRSRAVVAVVDDNGKARAAEARRRRMVKMKKMKGSFGSNRSLKCR